MSGISTHILDIAIGKPANGVTVTLEHIDKSGVWQTLSVQQTDNDGRCHQLIPDNIPFLPGQYRLRFQTKPYYASQLLDGLYPSIEITFIVRDTDAHLHIPLLLTPNGYTTYRGT